MNIVVILLGVIVVMAAAVAVYRRQAQSSQRDRQQLRDKLELIDLTKNLDSIKGEIDRAEKQRLDAIDSYNSIVWRPGSDQPGPGRSE